MITYTVKRYNNQKWITNDPKEVEILNSIYPSLDIEEFDTDAIDQISADTLKPYYVDVYDANTTQCHAIAGVDDFLAGKNYKHGAVFYHSPNVCRVYVMARNIKEAKETAIVNASLAVETGKLIETIDSGIFLGYDDLEAKVFFIKSSISDEEFHRLRHYIPELRWEAGHDLVYLDIDFNVYTCDEIIEKSIELFETYCSYAFCKWNKQ